MTTAQNRKIKVSLRPLARAAWRDAAMQSEMFGGVVVARVWLSVVPCGRRGANSEGRLPVRGLTGNDFRLAPLPRHKVSNSLRKRAPTAPPVSRVILRYSYLSSRWVQNRPQDRSCVRAHEPGSTSRGFHLGISGGGLTRECWVYKGISLPRRRMRFTDALDAP